MNIAAYYRARAAEFHAKAQSERSPGRRSQLETLERDYLRLAAQAELASPPAETWKERIAAIRH